MPVLDEAAHVAVPLGFPVLIPARPAQGGWHKKAFIGVGEEETNYKN